MKAANGLLTWTFFFLFHLQALSSPQQKPFSYLDSVDFSGDPVDILVSLHPEVAQEISQPRLLEILGEDRKTVWLTEGDKLRLRKQGVKFRDLTDFEDILGGERFENNVAINENKTWPTIGRDRTLAARIRAIIKTLSEDNLRTTLTTLSGFYSRYYATHHGQKSAEWIHSQILQIVQHAPPETVVSVSKFVHSFPQFSIIARFEPEKTLPAKQPAVIIGAHQDSANYLFPLLPAPGADDDGSGTVTILEAFRALAMSGFKPIKPVEFQWYAAEEGGLLGSRDIVKSYVELGKEVEAMIQFDMTAYNSGPVNGTLNLITSDSTKGLTKWAMELSKFYNDYPVGGSILNGGGSDHMSWYRAGFPAIFGAEGDDMNDGFDPYIHTVWDRINLPDGSELDFHHALQFSKLAVAFAVELGGWQNHGGRF